MADPVYMIDPHGKVRRIEAASAQDALDQGFKAASPEQAKDFELQQKYGDSDLKAGAEGFARGLTFGGSDQLLTKTGAVTPEALKARQEYNPVAANVGEFAGAVAPMLVPGVGEAEGAARLGAEGVEAGARAADEASALAKAARFAPSNLVSRVGQGVEHAVGAALPEADSLAGSIARNAISKGAGSAVEGAFYAGGHEVSEQALGDPNQNAESIAAHVGLGALFGAGLGGLTGAAEEAVPTVVSKAKDALSDIYGDAKDKLSTLYGTDVGQKITGTAADTADVLMDKRQQVADLLQKYPQMEAPLAQASPETANYVLDNFQKALTTNNRKAVATEMREGLQNLLDNVQAAHKKIYTELAPAEEESLLMGAQPKVVQDAYGKSFDALDEAVTRMRAEPELFNSGMARQLELIKDGIARDATDNPVAVYRRLKTLRQQLDGEINWKPGITPMAPAERNANNLYQDLYRQVGNTLKDTSVFGEQAARKAGLDEATSTWLRTLDNKSSDFKKLFLDNGKISVKKLNTWLNNGAKDEGGVGAEALSSFVDAARGVVDEAGSSFKNAPVGAFDHEALTSLVNKTAKQTADTREAASVASQINYMQSGGMGIPNSGGIGAVADQAASGLHSAVGLGLGVLHPVAGAAMVAGKALKGLGSVPRTVATLAAIERTAQKADKLIESGVATMLRGGVRASAIGRGEAAAGIGRWAAKSYDEQSKNYDKITQRIQQLANSPDMLHGALSDATSGLYEHAPDHAGALQMQQAMVVSFLNSKIPHHAKVGPLSAKWKSTPAEMGKFMRYVETVDKPLGITKKIAAGTAMPEHFEALAVAYPQMHSKMQQAAIAGMPKDPTKVPHRSRAGISMLLGQPADGSFTPAGIRANQAAYAPPAPAKAPIKPTSAGAGKLTVSNRMLTQQQASAQRGEG